MPNSESPRANVGRRDLLLAGGASLAGIALAASPAHAHSAHAPDGEAESSLFAAEFNAQTSASEVNVTAIGAAAAGMADGVNVLVPSPRKQGRTFSRGATVAVMLPPGGGAVDVNDLGAEGPVTAVQLVPLVFGDKPPRR